MSTDKEHLDRQRIEAATQLAKDAVVRGAGPDLDEVASARIHAKVTKAIDAMENRAWFWRPSPTRTWTRRMSIAALAAALILVVVWARDWTRPASRDMLVPCIVAGSSAQGSLAYARIGEHVDRLEVAAGGLVRAALGERARITIVGPGAVHAADGDARSLRIVLERGLLLAQLEHSEGTRLTVEAPGIVVTVVGTVFAVDARSSPASVAVLAGAVEVETRRGDNGRGTYPQPSHGARSRPDGRLSAPDGTRVRVTEDQSWSADASHSTISSEVRGALEDHARAALPPPSKGRGIFLLSGRPEHAHAMVGGASIGPTPFAAILPVGEAEITIEAPEHIAKTMTVPIREGETASRGFDLEETKPRPNDAPVIQEGSGDEETKPVRAARRDIAGSIRARSRPSATSTAQSPPHEESAEGLYTRAEAAMRERELSKARALLEAVKERFPNDPLAEAALLDLARLDSNAGDRRGARAHLDALLARGHDPAFLEPARALSCAMIDGTAGQEDCWEKFRADFPASPHDEEALLFLAGAAQARRDCKRAIALWDEYLSRHPNGAGAASANKRRTECKPR